MSSSDVCLMVNALARAFCDFKNSSNTDNLKNQLQFNTDYYCNNRLLIVSFINYEYSSNRNIFIGKNEQSILREFLLTYLEKFNNPNLFDIFISFQHCCLKVSIVSYERASATNDTSEVIKELENEISRAYENSIFLIIDNFLTNIPENSPICQIKNLKKCFNSGQYYSKYNCNFLANRSVLENTLLNWSSGKRNNNFIEEPFEPYEPNEPNEPGYPGEPSEPSDFMPIISRISSNINNNENNSDSQIQKAIAKILEITTTDEVTTI